MSDQPKTIEERIADRTDLTIAGATSVSPTAGGLAFKDMGQVMEFSKLMAVAGQAVPKHLRAAPGACLAVSLQALNWRMDPFAVANKSYMVNDRIAYEAQLIHAVVEQRAPITGRIMGALTGKGPTRKWTLTVTTTDGETIAFEGAEFQSITTKNSPLWKSDPDQQLWYYSVRAMCRRHFPDVLLGVYEKEEIEHGEKIRDVTPHEPGPLARMAAAARGRPVEAVQENAPTPAEDENQDIPDAEEAFDYGAVDLEDAFPGSDQWTAGEFAAEDGMTVADCPYPPGERQKMVDWLGGFAEVARRAAE